MNEPYSIFPIGFVCREAGKTYLDIQADYVPALKQLEHFSHILVFWWATELQVDTHRQALQVEPPYEAPMLGVFASRSPARPNPIALTTVRIEAVDHDRGRVEIDGIDAFDHTPIVDIKAHFPAEDRVRDIQLPVWARGWTEWLAKNNGLHHKQPSTEVTQVDRDFQVSPIGQVRNQGCRTFLQINEDYLPALEQLDQYSHIRLLWWFSRMQSSRIRRTTQCNPPYDNAPRTGVFASRSPALPNPIGLTTATLLNIDREKEQIEISSIDAFDKTPIIDIKPYIPSCDRVEHFFMPDWVAHWREWRPEDEDFSIGSPDVLRPAAIDILADFQADRPEPSPSAENEAPAFLPPADDPDFITVRGARQHNLKNINVRIPHGQFTVITGVSGSGKSSLAFDTIHAEGQRRYLDSLSAQARSFMGQVEKPEVDYIYGLTPTIAIEQRPLTRNLRSTGGSITDINDYLRVLFARLGTRHCPQCGRAIKPQQAWQITRQLIALRPGTHFSIYPPGGEDQACSFVVPDDPQSDAFDLKVEETVETLQKAGKGRLVLMLEDEESLLFSRHDECPHCEITFFDLAPHMFSANSPEGMCTSCRGLGVELTVNPDLIITHPERSVLDEASPFWGNLRRHREKPNANWMRAEILALAERWQVDLEPPWNELPKEFRQMALFGAGEEIYHFNYQTSKGRSGTISRPVSGAAVHIERLFAETTSDSARERLVEFMSEQPCSDCRGERLCPEARFVTLGGQRFPEIATMTLDQAQQYVIDLPHRLSAVQREVAKESLDQVTTRLQALVDIGLHYLALDRSAATLSGGEGQRIRLAIQLGCELASLLYILDEPSIGLHPRDQKKLLETLLKLRDAGNTIVAVEHDEAAMFAADYLIDMGPGAGALGGEVTATGTPEELIANPDSLTGRYLGGTLQVNPALENGAVPRTPQGWIELTGVRQHNLKNLDVRFPIGVFTAITGVSGSGKSSLVIQTLLPALIKSLSSSNGSSPPVLSGGAYDSITGLGQIDRVISIDQTPIGRTPRSNPATYTKVYDEIRKLFAKTPEAKARGYTPSRFSFNNQEGRCQVCQGQGKNRFEMHFMPDVWVTCPECKGRRFNPATLEIEYQDQNIADVLEMDIQQALEFFGGPASSDDPKITHILNTLYDVGLGYLKLGQSALTLSGGEAQRIKLSRELSRPDRGQTLYILDEPTTGLHFADIRKLLEVLHRLVSSGSTVIVIEHNLDIIRAADWVIDLGPDGGNAGGMLVAQGSPQEISEVAESYTGQFLAWQS